jgi:transcriptional regulator with XRE-family HTH domain
MKLSTIISDYRDRMQISQREFARRCDLSNSYISFLEKDVNPKTGRPMVPTIEQYKKLADGMGISLQKLFEMLDEDSPVSLSSQEPEAEPPANDDIRILVQRLNKLTPEQLAQAKSVFRAMFAITNPDLFEGDDDK